MHSFFDAMTPWPRNDGSLHVYALPDDDVVDRLFAASEPLDGIAALPRMPRAWLHFTVGRLAQFDDLGQAGLTRLADELGGALASIAAFDLQVGPPEVWGQSVNCSAEPSAAWDGLVAAVRAGAAAFADEPLPPAPHEPHVSLAYATGEVADDVVRARLAGASTVGSVGVQRVHLVSVTVRPEVGTFDWTELANWDLKGDAEESGA